VLHSSELSAVAPASTAVDLPGESCSSQAAS